VLASLSQMTGVFTGVLGMKVSLLFLAPLGVVQLAAGVWLVWCGFADPDASVTA
jgi:hypothetical protein